MALEEQIVQWSATRPGWQRLVLSRVATGDSLSDSDYDQLIDDMVATKQAENVNFGLAQLPQPSAEDLPVRLVSIAEPEHVNALASDQPLSFAPNGLTIVYGDNGSGKSGYARLLKRIMRARHREDILTDVFRDTSLERPSARLSVQIGDKSESLTWPDSTPSELQRMLFYDGACGIAYVTTESDFPYRPSSLFVMDGLIEACVEIRRRIDARLEENNRAAAPLPIVAEDMRPSDAGQFLSRLSGSTPVGMLDILIKRFDDSGETIDDLRDQEARLRSSDTSKERQRLTRQAEKCDALHKHLEKLHAMLGDDALRALQERRDAINALEEAANVLARTFHAEPLSGVGSSPWKALWESARRFSEEHAYPARTFPVVDYDGRCVLCQQQLAEEARDRLGRFEQFVADDTQVRLAAARAAYKPRHDSLTNLPVLSDAVVGYQKDLEATHPEMAAEVQTLLETYHGVLERTRNSLSGTESLQLFAVDPDVVLARLVDAATAARATAESLANPEVAQQRLAVVTGRRRELELLHEIKKARETILKEIQRLKKREALDAAKSAAATTSITKKILELSEESITEVVRDTFTRETERLRLERVTIARTRADKGALLHQPKLVGARQTATLPRVFSEGERTALGLAAYFSEAHLDQSKSALVLDDPVTSLDHVRRGLVAARLVELAENRQVVLFTHDVAFVADLKREANGKGVPVTERSVTRSRVDERKPGNCSSAHPWKARDVGARLDELRRELTRIEKGSGTWDDKAYEEATGVWAGNLSETWERIFSQEIVGLVLAEGGLEVRPNMVRILARFSETDHREFEGSYSRASQWTKRHDKSPAVNYVAPDVRALTEELGLVETWYKRVKGYKNA